jgi:sortase A
VTRFRRLLAALLTIVGAAALIWVSVAFLLAASTRREYEATLERERKAPPVEETARIPESVPLGDPIGTLELPRVGLSGVVAEGDQDAVLDVAIGHLPDTPLPWQPGNSALAAHRDQLFRSLKDVRIGDVLTLKTPHGDFDYRIRKTAIVKPDDLSVLESTSIPTLTLISCYPFNYVGHAPKRFVVHAERAGWVGEGQPEPKRGAVRSQTSLP